MPRKLSRFYLKQHDPLWIFKVKGRGARKVFLEMGCEEISKKEYDSYEKKGKQDVVSAPRRKRKRVKDHKSKA
tara:strand:+ start:31422 stop:31640 length:219 start_codon:yes stop_codon:yes gene_type:complete